MGTTNHLPLGVEVGFEGWNTKLKNITKKEGGGADYFSLILVSELRVNSCCLHVNFTDD